MLTAGLTAVAELPALSVTVAVAVRPLPSPVIVDGPGQATTPDRLSAQVQVMVTSPRYQPAALAAGAAWPTMVGAVLSTLIAATVAEAALPAASVAVPVTDWLAPSPTVGGVVQLATPDRPAWSAQVKPTVTLALYQPLALAGRSGAAEMVGGVLSMLTVAGSVAVLPALSVAVPVTGWSVPWVVTVWAAVHPAMPDRASAQVKVTLTSVLFQPWVLAAGAWVWLMVGAVMSILTVMVWTSSVLSALSTLQYWTVCTPSVAMATLVPVWSAPPSSL